MAAIRPVDTKPELIVRKGLHSHGLRFRVHDKRLPGKPDLVFARHRAAIFVNGCFFHGHDCHLFKWPRNNAEFWREKIQSNIARDARNKDELLAIGLRVATIWQCALIGKTKLDRHGAIQSLAHWVRTGSSLFELRGNQLGGNS